MVNQKTFGVLLFYAILVTVSLLILLSKVPVRLGGEVVSDGWQVEALGDRLEMLVDRTRLAAPAASPLSVSWGFGAGCATYRGVVVLPHPGGEEQLWLWALPEERRALRNPERRPLPGMTLYRDPLRSDLVSARDPGRGWVSVVMDPTVDVKEQPSAQLLVNNFTGQDALASAAGVNRGLSILVEPPQCNHTVQDAQTVELLMAVLRVTLCDAEDEGLCHGAGLSLYRGLVPDQYRLEARALEADCGRMNALVKLERDDGGNAARAEVRVNEASTRLRCILLLDAITPAPPGKTPQRTRILGRLPDGGNKQGTLDFNEILAGTGWR
jgi:hypothetical protein